MEEISKKNIILNKIKEIVDSKYLLFIISFFTIFIYVTNIHFLAYFVILIIGILIMYFNLDYKSFVGLFLLLIASRQEDINYSSKSSIVFLILLIPFVIIFLILLIKYLYKNKINNLKQLKKDFILFTLVAYLLICVISLINSPDMGRSIAGLRKIGFIVFIYLIGSILVDKNEENKDYFSYSFIIMGIALSILVLIAFILNIRDGRAFSDIIDKKDLNIGFGHQNHVCAMINICMIISFYYFIKHETLIERIPSIINIVFALLLNVLLACRAGYLGLIVILPALIIVYIYYHKKENISFKNDLVYIIIALSGILVGLIVIISLGYFKELITHFNNLGFSGNKRMDVYKIAFERFKKHPIIGNGVGTAYYYLKPTELEVWNYHNHYLQVLATTGIIGGIVFTLFLFFQIKKAWNKELYSLFILIITLYFLVHGALDTLYLNRIIMPLLLMLLIPINNETNRIENNQLI